MPMGKRVKVAGGEIAYDVTGGGAALLLLHAFPLSRAMWSGQVEAFERQWRVVRFDVRGLGESSASDGIVTMERIADDAAAILDHVGGSQAVVCGLSMGGYAALAFARRYPERLRGLVLADTRADADTPDARRGRAELGERIRREGTSAAADVMIPKLLGQTTKEQRPEIAAQLRRIIEATGPAGVCDALAGLAARADSRPTLRQIRVPTLVLCGEEDVLTPPAQAEALAGAIPGAHYELIPGAGHLSNLENPDAFNAALERFLRRLI